MSAHEFCAPSDTAVGPVGRAGNAKLSLPDTPLSMSSMILGIGIDIIEVSRIQDSYTRFGDRFLHRILRPEEIAYCFRYRRPGPFLAARFAAKEAISKAFGTGIGRHLGWLDIEVAHQESGAPYVVLHDGGSILMAQRGGRIIHLSLSHTENYATAVAVLES